MIFDFHTHRLDTPPGSGIVCLPRHIVLHPDTWQPHPRGRYAAGIHPWWTQDPDFRLQPHLDGLEQLLRLPQVEQVGECGIDRLRGAPEERQTEVFLAQVQLARRYARPMTLHVVRAFDLILRLHKQCRPAHPWTIHGFRGKPALARQLLAAGFDLSFPPRHNPQSYALTPPARRHLETDAPPHNPPSANPACEKTPFPPAHDIK